MLLLLLACSSPEAPREGSTDPDECRDGFDNDEDGLVDCGDPDCESVRDDCDELGRDSGDVPITVVVDSEGGHPLVPQEYWHRWDLDGCTDDQGEQHAAAYILGEAQSTAEGQLRVSETWYWLHPEPGFDGDCVALLSFEGSAVERSLLEELDAHEAEEGYRGLQQQVDGECRDKNLLALWEHSGAATWTGEEAHEMEALYVFDTLTPSGELNFENAMLVFFGAVDGEELRFHTDYARGSFHPETELLGPPASYAWETSICMAGR